MTCNQAPVSSGSAWTHPVSWPFTILGTLGVVGGGLLSAITAAHPSYHASWAVAYVVLVVGVAQLTLGVAQTSLTCGIVRGRVVVWEAICWNLGNALVLIGTLAGVPIVLYAGTLLFLAAIALFAVVIHNGRRGLFFGVAWALLVLLVVSAPVGAVIQAITG